MRKGLLFRLVKWSRAIRIFFGRYTAMEEKHKMFRLPKPFHPRWIYKMLIDDCYQYNTLSSTYKKQIFTVRKLGKDLRPLNEGEIFKLKGQLGARQVI